jgi:hypothetical protein
MNTNEHEVQFREELETRISSADWDRRIAKQVLAMRKRRLVLGAVFGGTGLAAAALIVALAAGLFTARTYPSAPMNALITAQVDGTYTEVFPGNGKKAAAAPVSTQDLDSYDSVDEMIDTTLAMR